MWQRLLSATRKEILSVVRDPRSRQMVILAPIMQLFVFTFAATLEVYNVDLAVINQDSGRWSRELIQRIEHSSFVGELSHLQNPQQLEADILNGRVLLGLNFPADFSRSVDADQPAQLQVIVDGRRANAGQISLSYIGSIARELGIELRQREHPNLVPPRPALRHWYNPNLNYRWFIVPTLGASLAMIIVLMLTVLSISRERELGTYDQLLVSPTTPLEIVVSKTIPGIAFGFLLSCVVMLVAIFLFRIPFTGSLGLLLLGLACFLLAIAGIGLSLSALCQNQQQATMGLFFTVVPIMLISGFFTPVENMPEWLQYVAALSPLKHMIIVIQGSYLKAMSSSEILSNIWPMVAIGAVTFTSAILLVRARSE